MNLLPLERQTIHLGSKLVEDVASNPHPWKGP